MRNEFEELKEARLLKVDKSRRRLRDDLKPFIKAIVAELATTLKELAIFAILLIGIGVINQLDTIMKTQADQMDQIMEIRQEMDTMSYLLFGDTLDELVVPGSEIAPQNEEMTSLGAYVITHYCACDICCGKYANGTTASGTVVKSNHTIATDPNVIPTGTQVVIDDIIYTAEDTGSAIKGNRIDIYVDSHQEAIHRGKLTREVFLLQ